MERAAKGRPRIGNGWGDVKEAGWRKAGWQEGEAAGQIPERSAEWDHPGAGAPRPRRSRAVEKNS